MKIILLIERLSIYFEVDTGVALAKKLGISPTVLANWKARNTIDWNLIFTKCEGINLNWLVFGEEPMLRNSSVSPIKDNNRGALEMIRELASENALLKKEIEDLKKGVAREEENPDLAATA